MLNTNPDDPRFIAVVKHLKQGDKIEVSDGVLICEYLFTVPSHFPFHQRIFEPGMILKKQDSNVRVYIPAEQLGFAVDPVARDDDGKPVEFDDHQVVDGEILPADRGTGYQA